MNLAARLLVGFNGVNVGELAAQHGLDPEEVYAVLRGEFVATR